MTNDVGTGLSAVSYDFDRTTFTQHGYYTSATINIFSSTLSVSIKIEVTGKAGPRSYRSRIGLFQTLFEINRKYLFKVEHLTRQLLRENVVKLLFSVGNILC
jgi:hypothetical protein